MVANALELLTQEPDLPFRHVSTFLGLSDEEFLLGHWGNQNPISSTAKVARELVRDVSERRGFVRCFAFGPLLISQPDPADETAVASKWEELALHVSGRDARKHSEFKHKIVQSTKRYLEAIGQPRMAASFQPYHLIVDLPDVQGPGKNTNFFVGDEKLGVRTYRELFQVGRWAAAYETQKALGHVYAPREYGAAVYFATRDLIKKEFGVEFNESSWTRTKLDPEALKETGDLLRGRLEAEPFNAGALSQRLITEADRAKREWFETYAEV